jgi:hypothetical protein
MFQQPQASGFDWARAIALNRDALIAIVAAIFKMLGLADDEMEERMAPRLHRRALRLLTPAESACRRLIVIAARGLTVQPPPAIRPAPAGVSAKTAKATGKAPNTPGRLRRPAFKLYDPRKSFMERPRRRSVLPRIMVIGHDPHLSPLWNRSPSAAARKPKPEPPDDGLINARPLCRRLQALKAALGDLPHQAQRLVQWQARRRQQQTLRPTFTTPLRPGDPPGYRQKPKHEVDRMLDECHWLACQAMRTDTS